MELSKLARIFAGVIVGLGSIALLAGLFPFQSESPGRYAVFLAVAILCSRLRLKLPTVTATLSTNFLFVLIGIIALSRAETMLLAGVVTLVQCYWDPPRKLRPIQVAFNIANVAISVLATSMVFQQSALGPTLADRSFRLILAAGLYFTLNSIPVAIMIGLTEHRSIAVAWRECFTWTLPYYLIGAVAATGFGFFKSQVDWPSLLLLVGFIYLMYRHYELYLARLESERRHSQEIASLHMRTIEALALAIEAKDAFTHDHLTRVQVYAVAIGEDMGLGESDLMALRAAALLHDIGKLAVPEHIVSKPGKLTREEFEKLKIHPIVGAEILERVKFPYPVVPVVRHHHEKWNGGGYPDGLVGEKIPMGARILAVVDTFDALASDRTYRPALPMDQAMERITAESGISFDPRVVAILKRRYRDLEILALQRLSDRAPLTTDWRVAGNAAPSSGVADPPRSNEAAPSFLASIAAARQEAQVLFELAQEIGNSLSLDDTVSLFALRLKRLVPHDAVAIFVIREHTLRTEHAAGDNFRYLAGIETPVGHGLSGWVAQTRKSVVNGNPAAEPGYDAEKLTPLQSALSIPLEGVNSVVGVLTLYAREKEAFTRDHLRILQAICGKLAMSVENALKYRQAESSASTDFLTGLLNARSLFLHLDSELARCRRLEYPVAVLVSDLDGFKAVNDRFGHLEGNKLLQKVAQKLKESCREYDCVARMGGDEFVMVLPGLTPPLVAALIPRLRDVVKLAGREVLNEDMVGFSVGEAYFPEDGASAEQLLAEADRRMYQRKAAYKLHRDKSRGFEFDAARTV